MNGCSIECEPADRTLSARLILYAFLSTVTMLFAGFTAAYLIRRTGQDWKPVELPRLAFVSTAVLVASSAALEIARRRISRRWLVASLALGALFIVLQGLVWRELAARGILLGSQPHASFVYMLTAVHGLHVLGGIAAMVAATRRVSRLALCATYWHFVGVVWIYLLLVLTLA